MTSAAPVSRPGATVQCVGVSQVFGVDGEDVHALRNVALEVAASEVVALFGPSGSGKSTLLALLAGLRRPTTGQVLLDGVDLAASSERELLRVRGRQVGVIVQNPSRSLLPYGTAEDNIAFARRAIGRDRRRTLPDPIELLGLLGLADLAGQQTAKLSGGEQQRLSTAVAIAGLPQLLLADEPTSQLDSVNRDRVVELMLRVRETFGITVVVITHDVLVADAADRTVTLAEGRVVGDTRYGRPRTRDRIDP